MHGFSNGLCMLQELCNDTSIKIIAIQEHWLTDNDIHKLSSVHPDFFAFGISAMNSILGSTIYRGRPYGGVGFLWHKSLSNHITIFRN